MDQELVDLCMEWAEDFLGTRERGRALFNVLSYVTRYKAGQRPSGQAGARKRTIQAATKHLRGLALALDRIDPLVLIKAVDSDPDFPRPLAPHRLQELQTFIGSLMRLEPALERLAGQEAVRRQRPALADPVLLGVEGLFDLWVKVHGALPTRSYKAGGFGDFALRVLGSALVGFSEASVRQAVRKVLIQRRYPKQSDKQTLPPLQSRDL